MWKYLYKICPWMHELSHMHSAFSPHAQLKSPHIASLSTPSPPSLTCTVRNHSLTASTPTKVKMNVLATCGGSRTREWERKKERRKRKDMASVHGSESVQQDSDTDINSMYHDYISCGLYLTKMRNEKKKEKSCSLTVYIAVGVCMIFICETFYPEMLPNNHFRYQYKATNSQSSLSFS